jgi:hypothetical protein
MIDGNIRYPVMALSPERRPDRAKVNEAGAETDKVRSATPQAPRFIGLATGLPKGSS